MVTTVGGACVQQSGRTDIEVKEEAVEKLLESADALSQKKEGCLRWLREAGKCED